MQGVCGSIAGNVVKSVANTHCIDDGLRPPGLFKVQIGLVNVVEIVVVTVDSKLCSGTGIGCNDVVNLFACLIAVFNLLYKRGKVLVVAFAFFKRQLNAEALLNVEVTLIDIVENVVARDTFALELITLCLPVQNENLCIVVVQVIRELVKKKSVSIYSGVSSGFGSIAAFGSCGIIVGYSSSCCVLGRLVVVVLCASDSHTHEHYNGKYQCNQSYR